MNYIIEDNLDFKQALVEDDCDIITNICLISQQQLTKSHIKLPCQHTFNYIPLLNEAIKQKQINVYETCRLKTNQLKCPYCRTVFDKLLPYIPSECDDRIYGVNFPFKHCMENNIQCDWETVDKGKCIIKCNKPAQYIAEQSYCKKHYTKTLSPLAQKVDTIELEWTTQMKEFCKSKTIVDIKKMLRDSKLKITGTKRILVERVFTNNINL